MIRKTVYSTVVNGRTIEATTPFNLRNVLLDERNALHRAAREVERAMEAEADPMLEHISRLGPLP